MDCKTPEQLAAEVAALEAARKAAREEDDRRKREEDDGTVINVVPIDVPGETRIELTGLYFNKSEIRAEDEPAQELIIEKDVLDRSTGMIFGRFEYKVPARAKIVWMAYIDGKRIFEGGSNLPYGATEGYYDIPIFWYPNSAAANKDGKHKVHVEYGVITGITESQLGLLLWGKVKSATSADFLIRLLPHKITG